MDLVFYHGNCIDGFTSAWAAWLKYGDTCEYVACEYGSPLPSVAGRNVLMVDFSASREEVMRMHEEAKSFRLLDHHVTAAEQLADLSYCYFDMSRSGCGITWDALHQRPRPWIIDYVEDRDLWRHTLVNTRSINAYIQTIEHSFQKWTELSDTTIDHAVTLGTGVLHKVESYVRSMAKLARIQPFAGYNIPVVNAPYINTSELVTFLSHGHPFALGWFQRADGKYQYSLRSAEGENVAKIAQQFGGGGHLAAAGFVSDYPFDELKKRT